MLAAYGTVCACVTAALACDPDLPGGGRKLESARYAVVYRAQPPKMPLGQHFSLEFAVCANPGAPPPETLSVDAWMPEHRHGMNYKVSVKPQPGGRYRADGLLFHMPGRWEVIFELRAAGRTDRLTQSEVIE